jgi:hypothetical protein
MEPTAFRLVAQYLNQLRHRMYHSVPRRNIKNNKARTILIIGSLNLARSSHLPITFHFLLVRLCALLSPSQSHFTCNRYKSATYTEEASLFQNLPIFSFPTLTAHKVITIHRNSNQSSFPRSSPSSHDEPFLSKLLNNQKSLTFII